MIFYKNAKIEPANNGYILCYDKYKKSHDSYDGMTYVGDCKEVYTEGSDAIKAMDKITVSEDYMPSNTPIHKG